MSLKATKVDARPSQLPSKRYSSSSSKYGPYGRGTRRGSVEDPRQDGESARCSSHDVKNGFRAARHVGAMEEADDGAQCWKQSSPNYGLEDYGVGGHSTLLPTHRHQRRIPPRCLRGSSGLGAGPPRGAIGVRRRNGQN